MRVALLVNKDNYERYAPNTPPEWEMIHIGNGEPDVTEIIATRADVLVVDAVMKIGPDIIAAMPDLKLIHSQGVAYNAIDLKEANRRGIYVCNNAGVNAQAVAEQVVLLTLSLLRNYRVNEDMVYAGRQMEAKTACFINGMRELGECSVGIVGLGAIGKALAERLAAFGCRLCYYDMYKPVTSVEYLPLTELYAASDIVSLHVPVTEETEGMINEESLRHFKKGAILINTARGELIDNAAVAQALVSGQLGGFGADTLSPEPVTADNPFLRALPDEARGRVALSPHIGGVTTGCFIRGYGNIMKNIAAISRGERPVFVVNGL
ncbi:MAG: hydroxyacid dehydrogenase [Clostridiales bacterium]|nr:hydroxyacid dehydrogenase [Clostridiales bacterium]